MVVFFDDSEVVIVVLDVVGGPEVVLVVFDIVDGSNVVLIVVGTVTDVVCV